MSIPSLKDLDEGALRGRRVLVRVDYNVPLDEHLQITDDTRIRATLPSLRYLLDRGARVVLLSHFGRPRGRPVPEMSLRPVAGRLSELLGRPVAFLPFTTGPQAREAVEQLGEGELLLLENTRFDPREERNDPAMAQELAELGDLFINDAFGAAHRAHASTTGVVEALRERGGEVAAGFLMQQELDYLGEALENPERPFVAILGGAKISSKIEIIEALLPKTDRLLIGGAMANTFFLARGLEVGASLVEADRVPLARELLESAGEKLVLPIDVVVAQAVKPGVATRTVPVEEIPEGWMALDLGSASIELFSRIVRSGRTVLWNGPVGVAEIPEFRAGTSAIAHTLADATREGATTIVGGGDSAAALLELGLQDQVSHLSTGGGASLEFLEGRTLPGVAALARERGTPA